MNSCGKNRSLLLICSDPFLQHHTLDAAHCLHLGYARVGDAIHVTIEESVLVGGSEIAIVRDALIEIVRDEIEDVLFQIGARATDGMHLVLADHLGKRPAEFRGAHCAGHGNEHLAAGFEVGAICIGGIDHCRGVEMTEVLAHEGGDGSTGGFVCHRLHVGLISDFRVSSFPRKRE